jgi:hypothetical protein
MKNSYTYFIAVFFCAVLTACGGSSGGSSTTPTPTPTPQPADPTATVSFTASSGETNTDVLFANLTGSENIDSFTFELNGITGHVVINGENVLIENNSVDVSSYASKDFQLMLNHDTAGTYNIAITGFTVGAKSYNLTDNQDITFTAPPTVTGRLSLTLQAAATGILVGNTDQSTPQEIEKGSVSEFLLRDLQSEIFTYTPGVEGKSLHSTVNLSLIDGQEKLMYEVGDYIIKVSGIANINGEDQIFSSTRKASVTQGGSISVGFALTAESVTSQQVDNMANYDSTFVDGDTKNITLSDIMPAGNCFMSFKQDNFLLGVNSNLDIQLVLLCLSGSETFLGLQLDVDQYVQVTFNSDSMADPVVYDVNDTVRAYEIYTPLNKGSSVINVSFGNVSYSDDLLNIYIKEPSVSNTPVYSPDMPIEGIHLPITIVE